MTSRFEMPSTRADQHWTRRMPERVPLGERRGTSKLTEAAVVEMRARFRAGARIAALARRFGVDWGVAKKAVHRETWRHVP